jgi:hypothetical protein
MANTKRSTLPYNRTAYEGLPGWESNSDPVNFNIDANETFEKPLNPYAFDELNKILRDEDPQAFEPEIAILHRRKNIERLQK